MCFMVVMDVLFFVCIVTSGSGGSSGSSRIRIGQHCRRNWRRRIGRPRLRNDRCAAELLSESSIHLNSYCCCCCCFCHHRCRCGCRLNCPKPVSKQNKPDHRQRRRRQQQKQSRSGSTSSVLPFHCKQAHASADTRACFAGLRRAFPARAIPTLLVCILSTVLDIVLASTEP